MGMTIAVEILDSPSPETDFKKIFSYFDYIDKKFSPYKETSEISKINRGELPEKNWSEDMKTVFTLSAETNQETNGYFDITAPNGKIDPSGLVKGWAIYNAAQILQKIGRENFYIDAGGDIQSLGKNSRGKNWSVGIKNPFHPEEIVKVIYIKNNEGVATSGTYLRGQHIYNPKNKTQPITEIVSLTVIGPNIYEADRFATAAFAMEQNGINFIENLDGFEGYQIDKNGQATMTSGLKKYTSINA